MELVGVGNCCYDYLCTIKEYPPEDGSTKILDIQTQGGGAVATALVAASRLETPVAFIGELGDDEVGQKIASELKRERVNLSAVDLRREVTSLTSYVMIQPEHGTRTKFPLLDHSPPFAWDERRKRMVKEAQAVHLDGTHYSNARNAAELAKKYGVTISLDGSTRQKDNRLNQELASMADILITSASYPTAVTGKNTLEEALLEMGTWGPSLVMATVGARGVYALMDGEIVHYPAKTAQVVDSTGAGDVFHGAFLAAYLKGHDPVQCIDVAQYAAARKCEQIGGRRGIPTWEQVQEYLLSSQSTV
ncbi:MAG TPA: carbohydrate kinase family protein [Limnochordia bacterium]|nr:carbohydrate kinase family protein [Limnochordia bacterium]